MKARELLEEIGQIDVKKIIASLERSVERENKATALVVAHLAILERERIHIDMGYSSLYAYCIKNLKGYSKQKAYRRIRAARAALHHPEILDDLESGALSLTAIAAVAKHLTGGVAGTELLAASRRKSVRQVKALVAARFPDPDSPRGELRIEPVGEDRVRIEMVVSTELAERVETARCIARHRNPGGDLESILSEALDLFLAHVENGNLAKVESTQLAQERPADMAPSGARGEVYEADKGRFTFEGPDRACGERAFIEIDHVEPRATGGQHLGREPLTASQVQHVFAAHKRRKFELEMDKERLPTSRSPAQTEQHLRSLLANLDVPGTEIRARTRAALEAHGPDAPLETLLLAALDRVPPRPQQGAP